MIPPGYVRRTQDKEMCARGIKKAAVAAVLLFLLASVYASAETTGTLEGRVVDRETDETLCGADVVLEGTGLGTSTDRDGKYAVSDVPAGVHTLVAMKMGYRRARKEVAVSAGEVVAVRFELEKTVYTLEEIVVTARGRITRREDVPGSVGIVREVDIETENPIGLSDAAAHLPGISAGSDMPWGSRVHVRGFSRDHVVFLVDGNRVSTTTELAAQFGTVAPHDIERVEILKGPISVLYGTGSIGGVVNVITRTGTFAGGGAWDIGWVSAYESSADGVNTYGRIGWNSPRFYILLTQSYRNYGSYRAGKGVQVPNSQFEDYQSSIGTGYRLTDRHRLEAKAQYMEARDVGIPGAEGVFPEPATATYPATRRTLLELRWTYLPSHGFWRESRLTLFLQPVDRRVEVIPNTVTETPTKHTRPQRIAPRADHDVMGARWQHTFRTARHTLVAGAAGWQKNLKGSRTREIDIDLYDSSGTCVRTVQQTIEDRPLPDALYRPIGVYAEDEVKLAPNVLLSLGGRIDRIHTENRRTYKTYVPLAEEVLWEATQDNDVSWSIQSGLLYRPVPGWHVHGVLARSFRSPGLEERYLYVDLGAQVRIGDPDLDPEEGWFSEVGIRVQRDAFTWTSQMFLNAARNLVVDAPYTYEGRPALRKTNAGGTRIYGFESEVNCTIGSKWLVSGDIAYTRGRDVENAKDLPTMPPLNAHLRVRYGANAGMWVEWAVGGVARQDRVAPGESETPGHVTSGIKLGYRGCTTGHVKHNVTLGVRNLSDRQYREHLTTSRGFPLYAPGRSVYLSWAVELQ